MERLEARPHIAAQRTSVVVWMALVFMTALLVFISRTYHEALSVAAMLTITPLKAGLVFYYFMHLKYESVELKSMVFVTLALLTLLIAFIFLDLSYR